jgi:hypothetical protein
MSQLLNLVMFIQIFTHVKFAENKRRWQREDVPFLAEFILLQYVLTGYVMLLNALMWPPDVCWCLTPQGTLEGTTRMLLGLIPEVPVDCLLSNFKFRAGPVNFPGVSLMLPAAAWCPVEESSPNEIFSVSYHCINNVGARVPGYCFGPLCLTWKIVLTQVFHFCLAIGEIQISQ